MSSSKPVGLLAVGLSLGLMTGAAWGADVYVNVIGIGDPNVLYFTAPTVTLAASQRLVRVTPFVGADQTDLITTPTNSPVTITAPVTDGHGQVFSHWNGCDSSSGTYLNTCNTTTSSAFKQVTAIYTNAGSRITNISTRAYVGTGEKVVILGFMISGGSKQVLIRGLGPSLETSGIYDCLKDPHLTLYQGSTPIQTNDDIVGVASVILEPRIYATLAPGAYTAILQASPKTSHSTTCPQSNLNTGIGLVSVEDQDQASSPSRLVNVSTRAYADLEGSSRQAIAGFVLSGTGKKRVFVKATGSTLGQYGIVQPLQDPTVGFFSGANKTYSLDNWRNDPNFNSILTINASLLHDAESAFLMELSPGAYTVQMGASYTGYTYGKMTGVGLISIEEDRAAGNYLPNLTTIYKRGVQCELPPVYRISGVPLSATLSETCPGAVIALCGAPDLKIYSADVTAVDLQTNLNAGWSTTRPTCN